MSNQSEPSSSLLEGVCAGSAGSWRRLQELYAPVLAHWCRRYGLQPADTDDVLQDVFCTVARRIGDFRREEDGTFSGWLFTIARSRIVDHLRREAREPDAVGGSDFQQRLGEVPQAEEDEEERVTFQRLALRQALDLVQQDVQPQTWQAFWRVVIDGQDTTRVAAELGMTVGAVRVAKSRVLRRIRDLLE